MEVLFQSAVKEVSKQIVKRRQNQGPKRRLSLSVSQMPVAEDRDFQETVSKLRQFGEGRQSLADFTAHDRFNLLDLFVNNTKVLMTMYEALFVSDLRQDYTPATLESTTNPARLRRSFDRRLKSDSVFHMINLRQSSDYSSTKSISQCNSSLLLQSLSIPTFTDKKGQSVDKLP